MREIRDISCSPHRKIGAKTQNGGPQLLVLYWRAEKIHIVKDHVSVWLRWLTKQGGGHPPISHPQRTEKIENRYSFFFSMTSTFIWHRHTATKMS
jgi:hypothetical protein